MGTIVVTGGAGFIGSSVVKILLEKGYSVRVLDDLSKPETKQISDVDFRKVDLTDKAATNKAFEGADYCIHLAAKIGGLAYLQKYPATILNENNRIYTSVFDAAKNCGIKRIVYISSGMVFEKASVFPCKEADLKNTAIPSQLYAFSKLIGEWYCKAFHQEFGLNYSIARLYNVYGMNDASKGSVGSNHVVPELIAKAISKQTPFEVLGSGLQIRAYTHIKDSADAIVTLMEHPRAVNEDFNMSSSEEITILELAKKIWNICNSGKEFKVKHLPALSNDMSRRVPDTSKAKDILGWEAKVNLDKGLKETIEWQKQSA